MLISLSVEKEFFVKRKFNIGVIFRVLKLILFDGDGIYFVQNVICKVKLMFNVCYVIVIISVLVMGISFFVVIVMGFLFNFVMNNIN